ncbi:hypothetical protein LTR36_003782 [Oleoguttula mirabilis]|uniref:SUN domain-containing protein n=1 Tax=Oleoguttula mirabilis TaxID=1507867 RepID=A0AAV9JHZ8_9PEZI|nr:hypothetical protein LTR36_003782 [Oleoguttula mirabilis]
MSQTPGRTTRARASRGNTPAPSAVPAIGVGQNFTYGAPGKAILRTQVATETTSLTSVMQNARAKSTKAPSRAQSVLDEEDEDDRQSVTSKTPSRRGPGRPRTGKRQQTAQSAMVEEDEPAVGGIGEPEDERTVRPAAARMGNRAPFQPDRGVMPPTTAAQQRQDGTEMDRSATVVDPGAGYGDGAAPPTSEFEPNRLQVTFGTIRKYVPRVLLEARQDAWSFLKALLFLVLLGLAVTGLVHSVPSLQNAWKAVSTVASTAPPAANVAQDMPPGDLARLWFEFRHNTSLSGRISPSDPNLKQYSVNLYFLDRLDKLDGKVEALETRVGINELTLSELSDLAPSLLVVEKKDDRWEIPELFWRALHERLENDDDVAAPLWTAFLRNNEDQISALGRAGADTGLQHAVERRHIISQDMLQEAIRENYANMEKHFGDQLRQSEALMLTKLKEEAERTTAAVIARSPAYRLSIMQATALAHANLIKNTQEAMENVNYFAPGLGARVNPHGSSLTYTKPGRSFFNYMYTDPHPPIKALQRWEEAGDCWCAAPSTEKGKAQLEIIMGQAIFPDRLIIEHMPRKGTLQVNAAPRELEIWIETESAARATELTKFLEEDVLAYGRGPCGEAPTTKHLCIGKGWYDIHYDNWVQTISMFAPMEANGIASNKIVVRVTSNWGADYTCLYRLRLTGERVVVTR